MALPTASGMRPHARSPGRGDWHGVESYARPQGRLVAGELASMGLIIVQSSHPVSAPSRQHHGGLQRLPLPSCLPERPTRCAIQGSTTRPASCASIGFVQMTSGYCAAWCQYGDCKRELWCFIPGTYPRRSGWRTFRDRCRSPRERGHSRRLGFCCGTARCSDGVRFVRACREIPGGWA